MKRLSTRHPGRRPAGRGVRLLLPGVLLALACSSSATTGPHGDVRLFVTNTTCDPGPCVTLDVRAFPDDQPHTPGGLWSIEVGTVEGEFDCLLLPRSGTFRVIDASSARTTTYTWTLSDPLSLGALRPGESGIMAVPSTETFVPAAAPGWSVSLPGGTGEVTTGGCGDI